MNGEIIPVYQLPATLRQYLERYSFTVAPNISIPSVRISISLILFSTVLFTPTVLHMLVSSVGFLISYQLYYLYGTRRSGEQAYGQLVLYSRWHIHHWCYCLLFLISLAILDASHPFLTGLCFGGITHGVQYSDWYVIDQRNQHVFVS